MKENIPFYLIESFIAACEGPNFDEAAKRLGLTQSALSRQMISFEELLPQKIFTFVGRKKELTKYGETLYELLAPQVLATKGLIHQANLINVDSSSAHIKICGRGEILERIACGVNFRGKVSFYPMDGDQVIDHIMSRKCDLGIVSKGMNSSELIMKPYFSNRLKIVVPKKLLSAKNIKNLQSLPVILYKNEDQVVDDFLNHFDIDFDKLNVLRVFPHYRSIKLMLDKNLGWAVIPNHIETPSNDFYTFEVTGKSKDVRDYSLCYRKEIKDSPWVKELLKELLKK